MWKIYDFDFVSTFNIRYINNAEIYATNKRSHALRRNVLGSKAHF